MQHLAKAALEMLGALLGVASLVLFATELLTRFFLTRSLLKLVFLFPTFLDLAANRLLRLVIKPRYRLLGYCYKCGKCCEQIVADPPRLVKGSVGLLRLFLAFHRLAHRFEMTGRGPNGEVIFRCGKLRPDGRCSDYCFRPRLCRDYPLLGWYERPFLMAECGFYAELRDGGSRRGCQGKGAVAKPHRK